MDDAPCGPTTQIKLFQILRIESILLRASDGVILHDFVHVMNDYISRINLHEKMMFDNFLYDVQKIAFMLTLHVPVKMRAYDTFFQ